MTKELYPTPGRITVVCIVESIKNGRRYRSEEKGTNGMKNAARDYKEKIRGAKLLALYKHMSQGGGSEATITGVDYDIDYFTDKVTLHKKTEEYQYKDGTRKRTFVWGTDKATGKTVYHKRLVRKADVDDITSQVVLGKKDEY